MASSSANGSAAGHISVKAFDSAVEDALKNNTPLLSWRSALYRVTTPSRSSIALRNLKSWLLSSPQLASLTGSYAVIPPPNGTSKQAFETKTAMINITSETVLPVPTIKEDALQLSKALNLDELEALRICILEHQERSPSLSETSDTSSDAISDIPTMSMFGRSTSKAKGGPGSNDAKEAVKKARQARQVKLYFSERRYRLKVATALVRIVVNHNASSPRRHPLYLTARKVLKAMISEGRKNSEKGFVEALIKNIGLAVAREEWERQVLTNIYHLLQFLFILMCGPISPSGTVVSSWYTQMGSTGFLTDQKFLSKPVNKAHQSLLNSIIPLGAIISLEILSVESFQARMVGTFLDNQKRDIDPSSSFYIYDPEAVNLVHEVLVENVGERIHPPAALAGWAWAIGISIYSNLIDDAKSLPLPQPDMDNLLRMETTLGAILSASTQPEGPALYIARNALKANLLSVIEQFVDGVQGGNGWSIQAEEDRDKMQYVLAGLMRMGMGFVGWDSEALQAFVTTHSPQPALTLLSDSEYFYPSDDQEEEDAAGAFNADEYPERSISKDLWSDPEAVSRTIHQAMARFPYESMTFCAILHAITPRRIVDEPFNLGFQYLRDHMDSFTYPLPLNFRGTEVYEGDAGKIVLNEDLMVLEGRREDGRGEIVLPRGILGRIISTGVSTPVVRWDFRYAGIPFLGRLLENVLLDESFHDSSLAIEILGIFENILASSQDAPQDAIDALDGASPAKVLLEEASDILAPNSDIVSVILDLFEASLPFSVEAKSVNLASACLRLIITLIPIVPGRIWPLVARSSLLERNGRGGLLTKILESVEIVNGDYTFLLTCFSLYETLLADAIAGVVYSGTVGAPGSIVAGAGVGSGISRDMQTSILQDWTRFWCSIYESFTTWKYLHVKQRLTLNYKICKTFSRVLETVYGITSDENDGHGLFEGLASSASVICGVFLDQSPTVAVDPILLAINEGLETIETTVHNLFVADWIANVAASLQFGGTALKVQHLQRRPPSHLEKELYGRSLDLVALYEVDEHYRRPVIEILDSLIGGAELWVGEPPSILGYIGSTGANHLVALLQRLGGRLGDEELESAIWRFFCTVIANKQQGLAIKLVTGSNLEIGAPKKQDEKSSKPSKSMLALALDILVSIRSLPTPLLLSTLQAVSIAQDFWGPIITNLPNYQDFLKAITDYVQNLKINYFGKKSSEVAEGCNETAAAAHISQILTMHLYQARTRKPDPKTQEFFQTLLPKLKFYVDNGVTITGYKPSMHGFLAVNFKNKWPCCNIENFRKSSIRPRNYGVNYFYDIELAEQILSWDRGWNNVTTRRTSDKIVEVRSGFRVDVESVNLNLALIDSQVFLLDMWSNLALELVCHKQFQNIAIVGALTKTVTDALKASITEATPPTISATLNAKRSSLAFSLFRRISSVNLPPAQTKPLFDSVLEAVWQVIGAVESDFLQSLSKGGSESSTNLLRLLYSALNLTLKSSPQPSPKVITLLVGVFDLVVTRAFKALASAAYESPATANPGDMLIVIGILQTVLSFQELEPAHEHFVTHLANNGTIRTATILFTWASKLVAQPTDSNASPDPLYGEISIMFLVKLSTLPILAEQLALNSVFNSLSEGDLAMKIQAGQLLPTTTPRLHNVWSKGFLPLLLNVLFALNKRIAPEIAMFLRSFIRQINFTMVYLNKPEFVTLPHLEEVTDLAALLILLEKMDSSPGDEIMARVRSLDAACDQITSHKTWLSRVLVATSVEEDAMLQSGADGNSKLAQKVILQAKMIQKIVSSLDGEDEQMS
ncbi:hypothetical protein ABW19_dt0207148 [Dactylella cylindrospora]|nr:hypothetical protein ABW19_dt0207148 [Dactylella cylindrospora]